MDNTKIKSPFGDISGVALEAYIRDGIQKDISENTKIFFKHDDYFMSKALNKLVSVKEFVELRAPVGPKVLVDITLWLCEKSHLFGNGISELLGVRYESDHDRVIIEMRVKGRLFNKSQKAIDWTKIKDIPMEEITGDDLSDGDVTVDLEAILINEMLNKSFKDQRSLEMHVRNSKDLLDMAPLEEWRSVMEDNRMLFKMTYYDHVYGE